MQQHKTSYDPDTKIWSGQNIPLMYHKNVSIGQIILDSLAKYPNRVVQVSENNGIEVTTDELRIWSVRAALHLSKLKLTSDDCIGIVAKNNHHLAPIVIGAFLTGVPIHPLDPSFDDSDISHIYNSSKPNVIFCDHDLYDLVKQSVEKIELTPTFVTFGEKLDSVRFVEEFFEPIEGEDNFVPTQIEDGETAPALILCSSGTTGLSKCVCLSHAQVVHKFTKFLVQTIDDVHSCFSSIYALTGIVSLLYGSITCCKRIITTNKFSPELFMQIVEKYRVTQVFGPPSSLGLILRHPQTKTTDFSSIRSYLCGGASIPPDFVIETCRLFENCKFNGSYGMSELGGLSSYNTTTNPRTVGYVSANTQIRIIDDDGNNLGPNQNGEIVKRSIYRFLGYKSEPELTSKTIDKEGWISSGDIGYFDEDGLLYIVDRKKDILIYMNYIVSPSEVEQFILKLKFVRSVCVTGVPDMLCGDLPTAIVVKTDDAESDEKVVEAIYNHIKDNLADYKLLRGGVYVVDEFPMTPSGKVVKRKLKELAIKMYEARK